MKTYCMKYFRHEIFTIYGILQTCTAQSQLNHNIMVGHNVYFLQGAPGTDGQPGNSGLPGPTVSKSSQLCT